MVMVGAMIANAKHIEALERDRKFCPRVTELQQRPRVPVITYSLLVYHG
jgi:hypothetical protein